MIQVVFENNEAEIPDEAGWLKTITEELRQRYGISRINIVSHSMGGPVTLFWALNLRDKNSPRLQKFVPIAGPFDGVIFTDDVPNQTESKKTGSRSGKMQRIKAIMKRETIFQEEFLS